jgi:hypothetical protein
MPFRSTIAVDDDFAAVTRRHFSPLAAFALFFFVTQIVCVVVALLTLRAQDAEITGGYGVDQAYTSSTGEPQSEASIGSPALDSEERGWLSE